MAMIFEISENAKFFCYARGVDMRKGIQSLYSLIRTGGELDALNGDVFIFIGSNCKSVKLLRWHKNGFLLSHKRLEVGRFIPLVKDDNKPFIEIERYLLRKIINRIKQRSLMSEIKQKAMLNI